MSQEKIERWDAVNGNEAPQDKLSATYLLCQLRRLAIERRPEACMGCGLEHGCSVHGCAAINEAMRRIQEEQ